MKKKRRNPRPERSAFENARAALERAGEEYPAVSEEDAAETPEPSEPTNVPEESETPTSVTADNTEQAPESADEAEAEISVNAEDAETQVSESTDGAETDIPESADSEETQVPENDEPEADIPAPTDDAETEASESANDGEAEGVESADDAETEASAGTDGAEAEGVEGADDVAEETPESTEQAAAFVQPDTAVERNRPEEVPDANAEFSEPSADTPSDEPEAVEDEDAEGDWEAEYEPFPGLDSEVTDTERHTMETKEITLGYKGPDADEPESNEAESGKKSEKRGKKSRFKAFNPLNRLKDAVQEYASREKPDREPDDVPPSASSRDAAIRKRVMQVTDEETRNYLLDRVLPQMTWYGRKSAQYQKMYYRLMVATIVLGALIPIFSLLAHPIIVAFLGVSVTAINAYLALRKYHELWVSYRNVREDLLHTLYCYFNRAGVFAKKDSAQEELDVLLVDTCENAFSKENGGWSTTMQKGA